MDNVRDQAEALLLLVPGLGDIAFSTWSPEKSANKIIAVAKRMIQPAAVIDGVVNGMP
jgi:hypothetical protein